MSALARPSLSALASRAKCSVSSTSTTMTLPPIFYHCFKTPLPYSLALSLQERIHGLQKLARLASRSHRDYLLLLEHRPVYTFGRRQLESSEEVAAEALRLKGLGADCVSTQRGGQTTYHGLGQIVGYPLLDLGRSSPPMGIREYICRDRKSTRLNSSHSGESRMPSSA